MTLRRNSKCRALFTFSVNKRVRHSSSSFPSDLWPSASILGIFSVPGQLMTSVSCAGAFQRAPALDSVRLVSRSMTLFPSLKPPTHLRHLVTRVVSGGSVSSHSPSWFVTSPPAVSAEPSAGAAALEAPICLQFHIGPCSKRLFLEDEATICVQECSFILWKCTALWGCWNEWCCREPNMFMVSILLV